MILKLHTCIQTFFWECFFFLNIMNLFQKKNCYKIAGHGSSKLWCWYAVINNKLYKSSKQKYNHYGDVTMTAMSSQITSPTIVYSTVYSDADQRKHHSSASLAFEWGIHRGPVNSPHKWPVTRKMSPFDDVIMTLFEWIFCPLAVWYYGHSILDQQLPWSL